MALTLTPSSFAVNFPHSNPAATVAVRKLREKRSEAGPIAEEWSVADHLAALSARLKPLKIIGIDLLDGAIHAHRALWPDSPEPTSVTRLADALKEGEDRLIEWRESAARAGGDEVLQFVLSWYEDINLDAV